MGERTGNPRLLRFVKWALPICCLLTIGLGLVKDLLQKSHPPSWVANKPWELYDGFVSIDGHAAMARGVRDWFAGTDPGGERVRAMFAGEMHPSAVVVPALVAALDLVVRSIPVSFILLSSLAVLLNAILAGMVVRELDPDCTPELPWLASLIVIAHCLTIRTSGQLLLDPFCALFATGAMLLATRWIRIGGAATAGFLIIIQICGIFTKISYAPMLMVPPVAVFFLERESRLGRTALAATMFTIVPAAAWAIFVEWLTGSIRSSDREAGHLLNSWHFNAGELIHLAVEMLLLFQGFAAVLLFRARRELGVAKIAGITLFFVLVSTWSFHLPAVPRLYLPAVVPLAVLCILAARDAWAGARATHFVAGYLIVNYLIAVAGLFVGG